MVWLPEAVGAGAAAGLVAASFLTSMLTAAFGIGGGVAMLTLLASILPAAALIPVHGVVQLGSNAGRAGILIRRVAWGILPAFVGGTLLGALAGGSLAVALPPSAVEIGVGLFVLASLVATFPETPGATPVAGAITGLLTMLFGATGPFVAAFLRQKRLQREAFVGTHAALMTLQHGIKVAVFAALGFAYGPWWALIAAMVASGFAGTVAGRQILLRIDERLFQRVLSVVLGLLALRLVWDGAARLAG